MSRPTIAAMLSFVVPGAGLWYLGERSSAVKNFLLAVLLTALSAATSYEHAHYLFLAIAAGSAGLCTRSCRVQRSGW